MEHHIPGSMKQLAIWSRFLLACYRIETYKCVRKDNGKYVDTTLHKFISVTQLIIIINCNKADVHILTVASKRQYNCNTDNLYHRLLSPLCRVQTKGGQWCGRSRFQRSAGTQSRRFPCMWFASWSALEESTAYEALVTRTKIWL